MIGATKQAGLPPDLILDLSEWHAFTWCTVQDPEDHTGHSLGVQPGDSLVDRFVLTSCLAIFHRHLISELPRNSLAVYAPTPQGWRFPDQDTGNAVSAT